MKTDLTKRIEQRLASYRPTTLGTFKPNYMRSSYDMYEVPVEHGNTKAGLIDYVWLCEGFTDSRDTYFCDAQKYYKNKWVTADTELKCGIPIDQLNDTNINKSEDLSDCVGCLFRHLRIERTGVKAVICFEIKVTKTDFHSSHGHNFAGNLNYYVVPTELYSKIKDEVPNTVGIVVFSDNESGGVIRKKKDPVWQNISEDQYNWFLLTALNKFQKQANKELWDLRTELSNINNYYNYLLSDYLDLKRNQVDIPKCFINHWNGPICDTFDNRIQERCLTCSFFSQAPLCERISRHVADTFDKRVYKELVDKINSNRKDL